MAANNAASAEVCCCCDCKPDDMAISVGKGKRRNKNTGSAVCQVGTFAASRSLRAIAFVSSVLLPDAIPGSRAATSWKRAVLALTAGALGLSVDAAAAGEGAMADDGEADVTRADTTTTTTD